MNVTKDVIAKQLGKKALHAIIIIYIVASGDLSKIFTRKLIFLVANVTVLVAVWIPDSDKLLLAYFSRFTVTCYNQMICFLLTFSYVQGEATRLL